MKKDKKKKEEIAEDYCFICKDGGLLLVCDYKNCLKAYHTSCIGKDDSFLETEKRWTCGWHTCSNCHKSSTFQCFCCPNSFCQACINGADFVQVKNKSRGFCGFCLKLTTMIEEHGDVDSDGEKVDFNDTSTYEFLFKDYWEIVKEKEGLTLTDLHAAAALLKSGKNYKTESDLDNLPEEDLVSEDDYLEDKYDEGIVVFDDMKGKCHKTKTPLKRSRSKKKTFIGWGSKELLQFLASVGKNTAQPLTQLDACEIVKDYIHEHNLFHPDKKKKVVSDGNLYSLFRKRSLKLHKIYSLLESHFAENEDSNDESSFSSEDGGDLIGIKKIATAYKLGDSSIDIVLKISNMYKDIQITMLSDDDIEEWIDKEILKLQRQIDRANVNDTEEETVATSGVVKLQQDSKGKGAACVTTQTKEAKDVNVADVPSPIEKLERGADVVVESLIQKPAEIGLKSGEIDETSGPKKIDKAKEDDPVVFRSLNDQIINIDEDEESAPNVLQNDEASTEETCEVWHYIDPSGNEQGPFSLASLRYWKEEGFFKDDFKVWRSGEPKESCRLFLLTNVLHLTSSS
ncbi:hypothetical protein J5N97_020116 [Dioscorea zingiberensis]|uniref:Uncharacterized protein n=1 Tax=Dioscorea zingiberensis TaxID=325984 RepID=A0A9D5CF64_9LILI|nr:hypothetical protein J5N97_020116 [Dioscorea zingiberensis]